MPGASTVLLTMDRAPAIDPTVLRVARERAVLTQLQLATRVGVVGGERISSWERGLSRPRTPAVLHALAGVLGVEPAALLADPADGPDLRWLRFAAGLSTAELAKRVGVSAATVQRWESGQRSRTLPTDVLEAIAGALGVSSAVAHVAVDRS
ncbi:MAG: helix-turn-helix domain-containing protein [Dermatophilaceae bacterium]